MRDNIQNHIDEVFDQIGVPRHSVLIGISSTMLDAGWASIDIDGPTPASEYFCSDLWLLKLYSTMRAIEIIEEKQSLGKGNMMSEINEKAEQTPPIVAIYGAVIGDVPIYDPRMDDYDTFVKRVSSQLSD